MPRYRILLPALVGSLLLSVISASGQGLTGTSRASALVVGIERYQDGTTCPGALASTDAFVSLLHEQLGVPEDRIIVLRNEEATREQILSELARLSSSPEKERIYVYVASRSFTPSRNPDLPGYVLPYDGLREVPDSLGSGRWAVRNGIPVQQFRFSGKESSTKEALIVLDMPVGGIRSTYPRASAEGHSDTLAVQQLLTAGRAREAVSGDSVSALVRALRAGLAAGRADANGNRVVTTQELARYVQRVVPALTENALHPQFRALNRARGFLGLPAGSSGEEPWMRAAEQQPLPGEQPIRLIVKSDPAGATVMLDGVSIGRTPLVISHLAGHYGEVSFTLDRPGYYSREIVVDIQPGDMVVVDRPLEVIPVRLVLEDLPAEARLFFDEANMPTNAAGEYWLSPGRHEIRIDLGAGRRIRKALQMKPDQEKSFAYRPYAYSPEVLLHNVFPPGLGQWKRGSRLEGGLLLGSTVFLAGFMGQNHAIYVNATRKHRSVQIDYLNAYAEAEVVAYREEMFRQYDRILMGKRNRDVGAALLGAVYAYHVADMLLFHSRGPLLVPRDRRGPVQVAFQMAPSSQGIAGTLAFQF